MFLVIFFIILIAIFSLKVKLYIRVLNERNESMLMLFALGIPIYIKKFNKINLLENSRKDKTSNHMKNRFKDKLKKILIGKLKNREVSITKVIQSIANSRVFKINKLNLNVNVSTGDAVLTSFSVFVISNIIPIIVRLFNIKINFKKSKYIVNPCYEEKIFFNINLQCIISANLVNIMYMLLRNKKRWRCM